MAPSVGVGQGVGPHNKKEPFFVRAPPPGPLRRGVVLLTGYRGMSHALFFRLRESSNPRPKGHIEIFDIYTILIKWLVAYKCDYRSHIKQVIISCEFLQYFKYLEVLLSSWMSLWYLNILGTWIEVLNRFENLLF